MTSRAQSVVCYAKSHVGLFNYPTKVGRQHAGLQGRDMVSEIIERCSMAGNPSRAALLVKPRLDGDVLKEQILDVPFVARKHETAPNTVELVVSEVGAAFQAGAGFDVHQSTRPFLAGPSLRIRWIPVRLSSSP